MTSRTLRFFIYTLFTIVVCVIARPTHAQLDEEWIPEFNAAITFHEDSTLEVTETIVYDFGQYERHGIYRDIPYSYKRNGADYKLRINVESVTDENNDPYTYETSKGNGYVDIKIGDGDVYISGEHTYVITYTVARAINFLETQDELFWNVTGNEWPVQIATAEATVSYPSADSEDVQVACYTGQYGETRSDCTINQEASSQSIQVSSDELLFSEEGLSVVLGLPKGVIQKPSSWVDLSYFVQDNWYVIFPIIGWILMHLLWRKKGKDPQGRGTVVPQYDPPDKMSPSLMGTLWDERADTKDISATLIHLAIRGFIKIKYKSKKNYTFTKLKEPDATFSQTDTEIWDGIFGKDKESVELDDLKNKFYKHLPPIKEAMYQSLIDGGYYPHNPQTEKAKWWGLSSLFIFGAFFLGSILENIVAGLSIGAVAVIIIVYGSLMSRKTKKGAEAKEEVEGFKWFLSVTDKERLKFHNAPEKKPEEFMEFLPYAMVLGVEKQWAGQFKDIYIESPSWYEGEPEITFSTIYLASALSSMNSNMSSTMTSRPNTAGSGGSGFGGGGFSGGGFGGGGGGSW